MALDATLNDLAARLSQLDEALDGLARAAADKPDEGDVVLADMVGNAAVDLLGYTKESRTAARRARAATAAGDLRRARKALAACHRRYDALSNLFWIDHVSFEYLLKLAKLGQERGGEWQEWARCVRQSLHACREPMLAAGRQLFACWFELSQGISGSPASVTVRTTNIGQKITQPLESAPGGVSRQGLG